MKESPIDDIASKLPSMTNDELYDLYVTVGAEIGNREYKEYENTRENRRDVTEGAEETRDKGIFE